MDDKTTWATTAEDSLAVDGSPFDTPPLRSACGSCFEVAELVPVPAGPDRHWRVCAGCVKAVPGLDLLMQSRERFAKAADAWSKTALAQRAEIERLQTLAKFWHETALGFSKQLEEAEAKPKKGRK